MQCLWTLHGIMPALRHIHGRLFLRQTDPESSKFLEDLSLIIFIIINKLRVGALVTSC